MLRTSRNTRGSESQPATPGSRHSDAASSALSGSRRAQGAIGGDTIDQVVLPELSGLTPLERVHTSSKLCITSFPDDDFDVDPDKFSELLAEGGSIFGPASDTVEKEEQNRLDAANRFRAELKNQLFADGADKATNETAFIGDSGDFLPDDEVGVYAVLWTMGSGHQVLSYRGSYGDIDFYNVRLLFGNFMYHKSREALVSGYREAGLSISEDEEDQEGAFEWFVRQGVRFGESHSKQSKPLPNLAVADLAGASLSALFTITSQSSMLASGRSSEP